MINKPNRSSSININITRAVGVVLPRNPRVVFVVSIAASLDGVPRARAKGNASVIPATSFMMTLKPLMTIGMKSCSLAAEAKARVKVSGPASGQQVRVKVEMGTPMARMASA